MNTLPVEPAQEAAPGAAGDDGALTPGERRLARSRAALEELLAPPVGEAFPRSETMRFVMGGKGRMVALGLFGGLLLVKPKLAAGLLRFLPLGNLLPVARGLMKALR